MTDASREFLVHRFVEDAAAHRRYSKSSLQSSDSEEPSSDSGHSELDPHSRPSERAVYPTSIHALTGSLQLAATLASLGHMQFIQPAAAAAACTLPLLYPHLYQSLLAFPNLDILRQRIQQQTCQEAAPVRQPRHEAESEEDKGSSQAKTPIRKRLGSADTQSSPKKHRQVKRVQSKADEETTSPVSGMYIRDAKDVPPEELAKSQQRSEDDAEDETALYVETSVEARAELALIPNIIGDYVCCLCKVRYEDAFKLARHKCPRIAHEEYRCPECSKVFSCPANLASHRRWHRPKPNAMPVKVTQPEGDEPVVQQQDVLTAFASSYVCDVCGRRFESHRLLRAHSIRHTNFAPTDQDLEVQCDQDACQLWFPNQESLDDHRSVAHEKIACGFCGKTQTSVELLVRHIAHCHSSEMSHH